MQVQENIDSMFELMPFRSKWAPVDHFIQLGGVTKCFQVIGIKNVMMLDAFNLVNY